MSFSQYQKVSIFKHTQLVTEQMGEWNNSWYITFNELVAEKVG